MTLYQKIYTTYYILKHKLYVFYYILKFCKILIIRGLKHDNSKFSKEEFEYVYKLCKNGGRVKFGSQEYYDLVDLVLPAKEAHFTRNDHHIDYFNGNIKEMNIFQIGEMICDWFAATKRNNGNIYDSLDINSQKYNIQPKFKNRLFNTINELNGRN